jgi:RNA polymerase primary sigma factor
MGTPLHSASSAEDGSGHSSAKRAVTQSTRNKFIGGGTQAGSGEVKPERGVSAFDRLRRLVIGRDLFEDEDETEEFEFKGEPQPTHQQRAQAAGQPDPRQARSEEAPARSRGSTTRQGAQRSSGRVSSDSIGWYLSNIGRVPLLTAAEEIELAHHVQAAKRLQQQAQGAFTPRQLRQIRMGQRARDRMMAANLRLVVSVAKKYQNQGLELLDLVQEGAIGLERAVDKFDPAMGYKFSTYAYWWIRQGMTRAIDNSARTIRLPIHISEKLSKMRRITRELSHRLGRQPNRLELSHAMGMAPEELEELLAQSAPCASLDAHARGDEDRSTLGELIADPSSGEHFDSMDRHLLKEHLGGWLSQLNEREQQILKLRFGLEGSEPLTLAEIGRQLNVSRERVRQLEAKAILKLRLMSNHHQAA